jgi:hypothetical protein
VRAHSQTRDEEAVSAGEVKTAARAASDAETASRRGALRLRVHVAFGCLEAAKRQQALTGCEEVRVFGELIDDPDEPGRGSDGQSLNYYCASTTLNLDS